MKIKATILVLNFDQDLKIYFSKKKRVVFRLVSWPINLYKKNILLHFFASSSSVSIKLLLLFFWNICFNYWFTLTKQETQKLLRLDAFCDLNFICVRKTEWNIFICITFSFFFYLSIYLSQNQITRKSGYRNKKKILIEFFPNFLKFSCF